MSVRLSIETKLKTLSPNHLELINESHQHAHGASDSHYKLILVSDEFKGMRTVARHQKIYQLLADELKPPYMLCLCIFTAKQNGKTPKCPHPQLHGAWTLIFLI